MIKFEPAKNKKIKPDPNNLGFGKFFTDHMFVMDYTKGKGWHDPVIKEYAPLSFEPSTIVFHYSQTVFEGLKAYKGDGGKILLFRPEKNMARLNVSNDRLAIPEIDEKLAVEAVKELVRADKDWIPDVKDSSLYVRPFIIATDPYLGVKPSDTYKFMIIASPVGPYYPEGINPVKIYVEDKYVRAVRGGTGYTKTGGNYAASIRPQVIANNAGYTQVLYLDALEYKYVEEVGSMNVFFKIDDEFITPAIQGSILEGVTRDSVIRILKDMNMKVVERPIEINEIVEYYKSGRLKEMFGTGTAAVISPVGCLKYGDIVMNINDNQTGEYSKKLYDTLTGIQCGRLEDKFNFTTVV